MSAIIPAYEKSGAPFGERPIFTNSTTQTTRRYP
jgi:hypothetical protein